MLAVFFDAPPQPGVPEAPKPVVRRARRSPPAKPSPSPTENLLEEKVPELPSPQEVFRGLPKDAAGGVDWVRALAEKLIQPSAGIDPDTKDEPILPLEVVLTPEGQPFFKVVFPHEPHTQVLACANCHPRIFQMRGGADPITMAKIYAGEYCGRCHGKVAFAIPTGCPRCHPALAPPRRAAPRTGAR